MSQVVPSEPSAPVLRPLRKECPPGACDCQRDALMECLHAPEARVLWLTREEEKRLIERITRVASYEELLHVGSLMHKNLGIRLHISPGPNEVRTVRGLQIHLEQQPGLCRKTRDTIPAAIRKCLENNPHIVYALLDAHDLLGATTPPSPQS